MPPFTESTISSTATYANGGYITYTPISTTTTGTIYAAYNTSEEKMKEYTEKVDKHVDQLEEDIEFLNNERESLKYVVKRIDADLDTATYRINALEDENTKLKAHIDYLERKIYELEAKFNGLRLS